jgi:hypothetical protein
MIEQASLVIGNDNFAVKENSFLGYALNQNLYVPREMDVVRATTATRVNEQGLIEVVPRNLFTYSEQFNDASWVKAGVSVTTNTTTAPDGTLTADSVIENSATATQHRMAKFSISLTSGTTYTISAYVKRGVGSRNVQFGGSGTGVWIRVYFDLTNGTVGSQVNGTGTITNVGDGWYKITATGVCDLTGNNTFFLANTNGTTSGSETYNGDGVSSIVWWGAQLESGSSATEYFPTTDRLDVPRVDYSNGTPSILVEPQRTNLALRSQEFNDSAWITNAFGATVTSNSIIAPDGTNSADAIFTTNSVGVHYIQQRTGTATAGTTYTMSVYVKKLGYDYCQILTSNTATGIGVFRFSTKTLTISGADVVANSGKVTEMADGWFRIQISILAPASASWRWWIQCLNDSADASFTGDVTKGLYVWSFQFEVGSYATSYIPTVASTVTRNADVFSVSLPNTDMTFCAYLELAEPTLGSFSGDWLQIYSDVSALGRAYGYAQVVGFANDYNSGVDASTSRKIIWKQESGTTAKIFLDGVLVSTSTTGTYSNPFNRFLINGANLSKPAKINMFTFFNENLTDAQCIELTTL